ncbi:hypothetical protein Tco_0461796 [Tanacetum coccineum]
MWICQLVRNKSKSYEEIQKLFDNEMRRVNTFIPMDSEEVKSKKETEEESFSKRTKQRADGSSKRYSSMIRMLQDIDREDLQTL